MVERVDGVVEFHARGLVERYGFGKGRLLDGIILADGYPPDARVVLDDPEAGRSEEAFSHVILEACVLRFLAPAITGLRIERRRAPRDNPVRLAGAFYGDHAKRVMSLLDSTVVRVAVEDVRTVARTTAERHGVARVG